MKKFFAAVIASMYSIITGFAQFGPSFFPDTLDHGTISQIICADFNQDQVQDILVSNLQWPHDHMRLYTQNGQQEFSAQTLPATDSLTNLEYFDVGDINVDGWNDMIVCHGFPYQITWFENQQGQFIPHLLNDSIDFTTQVLLADFDQNGMPDVLALQHTEIVVYMAIAPGVFDTARVMHSGTEFYAIEVGDYNADSHLDVAVGSGGFEIFLGDGTGQFTFHFQLGLPLVFGLQSADLDGDMDIDIASYDVLSGINFYANDGSGQFTLQNPILSSSHHFRQFVLADMNCDLTIDVLTALDQQHQVVWMQNDGSGHFSPPEVLHEQDPELIMAVSLGDLNQDGQPDPVWGNITLGGRLNECMTTSIQDPPATHEVFRFHPNPAQHGDVIRIVMEQPGETISLILSDLSGRMIQSAIRSGSEFEFQLPDVPGAFILWMKTGHGHEARMITVY